MTNDEFAGLLNKAVTGSPEAIEEILRLYMHLIDHHSYVDGVFDEDCRQYIMMRVAIQISNFKI